MSKQSRNRNRVKKALAITSHGEIDTFGLNMDDRTGTPVSDVRSVSEWYVQSSAVHSKSLGWIPSLVVTITHHPSGPDDPDREPRVIKLAISGPEAMLDVVVNMNTAMDHALLDAAAGYKLR